MQTITTDTNLRMAALRSCQYFRGLDEDILVDMVSATSLVQYERGEAVIWQEDPCPGLYVIAQGSVKLFRISPQGRELIVRILHEGAAFNEVPVFDGGTNPINVACLEESRIWLVQSEAIHQAMAMHPKMSSEVIQQLSRHLRQLINHMEEMSFYQVTNRLARLLNTLSEEQRSGGSRLTQDQLAASLGTVREVVARGLRELERSGAIQLERRQIRIVDREILQRWANEPKN